jgi:uncharacterized protein YlxW (UPF0749 family)
MFGLSETIWVWVFVALLAVFGTMSGTIYVQHQHNVTLDTQKTAAENARDAAQKNEKTLKDSATAWEKTATDVNQACEDYKHDQKNLGEQNAAAVASAKAGERSARASLDAWKEKYKKATQGKCADLLNTPICVEALPNE